MRPPAGGGGHRGRQRYWLTVTGYWLIFSGSLVNQFRMSQYVGLPAG